MSLTDSADILEVLKIYSDADSMGDLWWRCDDEYAPVTFLINVNDFFYPAADAEEVTKEDIPALRQALEDCQKLDENAEVGKGYAVIYFDDLFVARKRKLRPWKRKYEKILCERVKPLFYAAGDKFSFGDS